MLRSKWASSGFAVFWPKNRERRLITKVLRLAMTVTKVEPVLPPISFLTRGSPSTKDGAEAGERDKVACNPVKTGLRVQKEF